VWLFAAVGIALAAKLFAVELSLPMVVLGGLAAAVAEAVAPRASDNVLVPVAVFGCLVLGG
jgi:hypothetical protein